MGFFFEAQGGGLFMAWYHYGATGTSRWWSSGAPFAGTTTLYSSDLEEWANGQSIGGPYVAPTVAGIPSAISVQFLGGSQATLTWDHGTLNLQRFRFENLM